MSSLTTCHRVPPPALPRLRALSSPPTTSLAPLPSKSDARYVFLFRPLLCLSLQLLLPLSDFRSLFQSRFLSLSLIRFLPFTCLPVLLSCSVFLLGCQAQPSPAVAFEESTDLKLHPPKKGTSSVLRTVLLCCSLHSSRTCTLTLSLLLVVRTASLSLSLIRSCSGLFVNKERKVGSRRDLNAVEARARRSHDRLHTQETERELLADIRRGRERECVCVLEQ